MMQAGSVITADTSLAGKVWNIFSDVGRRECVQRGKTIERERDRERKRESEKERERERERQRESEKERE